MAVDRNIDDGFLPSVFDRLIDPESAGRAAQRGYTERQLADAVRRDLEELLNTRRPSYEQLAIEDYPQVRKSIIGYGLPDFASLRGLSDENRSDIARQIAEAIETFEPRLTDVEVQIKDTNKLREELKHKFQLTAVYFHIEAKMRMDPCPPVTFETTLELTQGRHRIEGGIIE
jgi:type VI secretion system protein ImpF